MKPVQAPTESFALAGFVWRARAGQRAAVEAVCGHLGDLGRVPGAECVKRALAREVWRLPLASGVVYLKRFRVRGVFEQLKYRVRPPRAEAEWRAATALAERGIAATPPLAVGLSRRGLLLSDGLFLAAEVPGVPYTDALQRLRGSRGSAESLVHETLALYHDLVRSHVLHPDLHSGNMLVDLPGGAPKLTLVDLHSIHFPRRLSARGQQRMRSKFAHSMWRVLEPGEYEILLDELARNDRGPLESRVAAMETARLASRDERCLVNSSAFVAERADGWRIHRRREVGRASLIEIAARGPCEDTARVARVEVEGELRPVTVHVRGESWLPEWKQLHALDVRSVPTLRALACFERRRPGRVRRSLLFLEPLPGARPAERAEEALRTLFDERLEPAGTQDPGN